MSKKKPAEAAGSLLPPLNPLPEGQRCPHCGRIGGGAALAKWDVEVIARLQKLVEEHGGEMVGWSDDEAAVLRAADWTPPPEDGDLPRKPKRGTYSRAGMKYVPPTNKAGRKGKGVKRGV
jgi:hypothetical protein